ncbi:MAG: hypothetical protein KDA58_15100, partial [Planctomycetaceae bacterium]|nr:hypothetical protein [Planctomycetaceae bacterium]
FDRATPVSYRIQVATESGEQAELWGYFQVREEKTQPVLPFTLSPDLQRPTVVDASQQVAPPVKNVVDLLPLIDPDTCWKQGDWTLSESVLLSPKAYGARIEIPYTPPTEYRLLAIVQPLDPPNGLLLGQRLNDHRFVTLLNYHPGKIGLSAIENIQGQNVGNATTYQGDVFQPGQLSQVIATVRRNHVHLAVDGRTLINWQGSPEDLSLSDYWKTPNEKALFLGTYDCRYRIHRLQLEPLTGEGMVLETAE